MFRFIRNRLCGVPLLDVHEPIEIRAVARATLIEGVACGHFAFY
jgi:hypothetical protein